MDQIRITNSARHKSHCEDRSPSPEKYTSTEQYVSKPGGIVLYEEWLECLKNLLREMGWDLNNWPKCIQTCNESTYNPPLSNKCTFFALSRLASYFSTCFNHSGIQKDRVYEWATEEKTWKLKSPPRNSLHTDWSQFSPASMVFNASRHQVFSRLRAVLCPPFQCGPFRCTSYCKAIRNSRGDVSIWHHHLLTIASRWVSHFTSSRSHFWRGILDINLTILDQQNQAEWKPPLLNA